MENTSKLIQLYLIFIYRAPWWVGAVAILINNLIERLVRGDTRMRFKEALPNSEVFIANARKNVISMDGER